MEVMEQWSGLYRYAMETTILHAIMPIIGRERPLTYITCFKKMIFHVLRIFGNAEQCSSQVIW